MMMMKNHFIVNKSDCLNKIAEQSFESLDMPNQRNDLKRLVITNDILQ